MTVRSGAGGPVAVAVNKNSGKIVWRSQASGNGSYAHPIIADVAGSKQLIVYAAAGPIGMLEFGVVPALARVDMLGLALFIICTGPGLWSADGRPLSTAIPGTNASAVVSKVQSPPVLWRRPSKKPPSAKKSRSSSRVVRRSSSTS